jgi:hypothetical protein
MKIQIKLKEGYRLLHNAFISRGVFYRKSLIMLLCIAFFPVVVISIVNYWIGTKQVRDEVTRNHSIQLELIFQNMDRQLNQIAMISGQWGFSPTLTNDLKGTNLTVEYSRFQDIMSGLRIIEGSSSLVHSAALYINTDFGDQLLSNKLGRRVLEDSGEKALYRNYLTSYPSYVWEMTSKFTNNDEIVQQVLMQKIPANLTRPYGLLMIFLSKKGMQEAIGQLPSELGTSFILDGAGDLLINGSHAMQPLPVEERLKKLVIDRGDAQGTFQSQEEKENFLVSYRTLSRNGWRFVIATPLSKLMAPVMFNSLLIVGVSIFILFLTIIASFFAARRIYHPIRNLISMIEGSTANRSMES